MATLLMQSCFPGHTKTRQAVGLRLIHVSETPDQRYVVFTFARFTWETLAEEIKLPHILPPRFSLLLPLLNNNP